MIKVVLFDADGVALLKHGYFSDRLSRDCGIPTEKIVPFFKTEFRTCQLGKADLKQELTKYLADWNWKKSVDDFLDYWFIKDTLVDEKVLVQAERFRSKGVKCYLVSDQEKYRAEYIRKNLRFDTKFDDCFFSCEIGYSKADPEFFRSVLNRLDARPEEVLYFDDEEKNVQNALSLDITSKLYFDLKDLELIKL
jgi:putative hydrolase of the HAD superfamily